ncbi:flagellar biosynthesis anti-sigma factor FlgM [Altererythrobacter soli]|uniref:Negative regulator of flagellin synthesis n=1 Tax=Croceibacterium soli TaxID=1739690 RepID=A0A6I4URD9_9SPHN|nr:flagellar biosynthesis anti-sigma factor FlgM [Croceibacterium soli]MXP41550.1 flagellar biosynthesis anti-sigma factor FlgM [Croceibacterium soli]
MDRIDMQGPNGISSRLKGKGPAPVTQAESVRPAAGGIARQGDASAASIVSAGTEAPVDSARVAELRAAIEQGRYKLDPAKTADAMIAAGFLSRK